MKANVIALLAAAVLAAGCTTTETTTPKPTQPAPSAIAKVALLYSKPDKTYRELGTVTTLKAPPEPGTTWQMALQKQAALMGADAVVVDMTTLNNTFTTTVMGTAIQYTAESH